MVHCAASRAGMGRFSVSQPCNPQKCRLSNRFRRHFSLSPISSPNLLRSAGRLSRWHWQRHNNPIYIGEIRHKGVHYPGQHEAIVDRDTWEAVQRRLCDQTVREGSPKIKAASSILAGKLFDENGEPLYATAAKGRHGGRYRYYVSRALIRRGACSVAKEKARRLAAPELERSVLVSVQRILNDGAAIAARLQEAEIPLADIQLVLKAAEARAATLESLPQGTLTIAELVDRVALRKNGVAISINLESLFPAGLMVSQRPLLTFTEFVPLRMKRRGVAMRLVIDGTVSTGTADATLLKAVARGRKWFNELASGLAKFTQEIAVGLATHGALPTSQTNSTKAKSVQHDIPPTRVTIKRSSLSVRSDWLAERGGFEPYTTGASIGGNSTRGWRTIRLVKSIRAGEMFIQRLLEQLEPQAG